MEMDASTPSTGSQDTLTNDGQSPRRTGMMREDSKVYTSFPRPFNSPSEDETAKQAASSHSFFGRFLGPDRKVDLQRQQDTSFDYHYQDDLERQPGLPKVTRECLIAEIKCYGSYILPTLFVFVVLVLVIALTLYNSHKQ